MSYQFKIAVVGDASVGKTNFIRRHETGEFEMKYINSNGVNTSTLSFNTSVGSVNFTIHDIFDVETLTEVYDGIIIMFDVTNRDTYKNVSKWYEKARTLSSNIVLCGNKVDCLNRTVKSQMITFHIHNNIPYFDVSAKSCYNSDKPFVHIIHKLINDDAHLVDVNA